MGGGAGPSRAGFWLGLRPTCASLCLGENVTGDHVVCWGGRLPARSFVTQAPEAQHPPTASPNTEHYFVPAFSHLPAFQVLVTQACELGWLWRKEQAACKAPCDTVGVDGLFCAALRQRCR